MNAHDVHLYTTTVIKDIENILDKASERDRLVQGQFQFSDAEDLYDCISTWVCMSQLRKYVRLQQIQRGVTSGIDGVHAFQLAAMSGHGEVVKILLNEGADVLGTGFMGWNIVHCLAVTSAEYTAVADIYDIVVKYLQKQDSGVNVIRKLLMTEDVNGYRPLELAMRVSSFAMSRKILNTEGVYKFTRMNMGTHDKVLFDITDYIVGGDRLSRSPLALLMYTTFERIRTKNRKAFSRSPVMQLARISQRYYFVLVLIWSVYRLGHALLFMVFFQDMLMKVFFEHLQSSTGDSSNSTANFISCSEKPILNTSVDTTFSLVSAYLYVRLFFTLLAHSADFYAFCKDRNVAQPILHFETKETKVTSLFFFYTCDIIHTFSSVIVLEILRPPSNFGPETKLFVFLCIALACITNIWSLLYFVRLAPRVGYFVIVFQEMMANLAQFLVIYGLILVSFFMTFYSLFGSKCLGSFKDAATSLYSTFTMMLNMVQVIGDGIELSTPEGAIASLLHVIYVGVVAILLLNFLIAIMSSRVTQIAECREIVIQLHRLSTGLIIERRLAWLLKKVYIPKNPRLLYLDGKVYIVSSIDVRTHMMK